MHELSLASSIIDVVRESLSPNQRLQVVHVTVGVLSGVNAHSLEFCFTELAEQQGLGRPVIEIVRLPAKTRCRACAHEHGTEDFSIGCPACGSLDRDIASGFECDVDWLKVEED